jgi:hypothetical protein
MANDADVKSDATPQFISAIEAAALLWKLRNIDFEKVAYHKIKAILLTAFGAPPPICDGTIHEGAVLLRARINAPGQIFMSESEISYRNDDFNVREMGRASLMFHPMFYGTLFQGNINEATVNIIAEISERYRAITGVDLDGPVNDVGEIEELYVTVGAWQVVRPFQVAQALFSRRYIREIEWIGKGFLHFMDKFEKKLSGEQLDTVRLLLEFISDQFAKSPITHHSQYAFSAAYAAYAVVAHDLAGVLYPSVAVGGHGLNVAIRPHAAEQNLQLAEAQMMRVRFSSRCTEMETIKYADGFGPLNSAFNWKDPYVTERYQHVIERERRNV